MNFKDSNGKEYELDPHIRNVLKPDWQEMLKPAKKRTFVTTPYQQFRWLLNAEASLFEHKEHLVGKDILEVGCGYGNHSFLMAKYEGAKVHGIDVNDYTINQSPDMNDWNPKDFEYAQETIDKIRKEAGDKFPKSVTDKVTFETCKIEDYATPNPHDVIFSFDVLEHVLDMPLAFNKMANALKKGGIAYHEWNPFLSLTGGHSPCTLDFHYGHCRLSAKDFERYIRELRPEEEKVALNFYYKCLNRTTITEIKECAGNSGFEILEIDGTHPYKSAEKDVCGSLVQNILPDVTKLYPKAILEDVLWNSVHIILRKK